MTPHLIQRGVQLDVGYLHEGPGLREAFERTQVRLNRLDRGAAMITQIVSVYDFLKERCPDLLHTTLFESDIAGRTAARIARVPVTSSVVNVGYSPPLSDRATLRRIKTRRAILLDRTTSRWTAGFHAISDVTADFAAQELHVPRDRIQVIPRGRDLAVLGTRTPQRRMITRQNLGLPESSPMVLFAARNEQQKGLDILLRSFSDVLSVYRQAHLVIAGRRARNATITDHLAELLPRDQVHFLGVRNDVPDLLASCDVFVLPSRWEGLGGVLLEAMALEAPIVASDLPATRQFLETGKTAVLVPPADVGALTGAIITSLGFPQDARERARLALHRFQESYTIEGVVDSMVGFWERSINAAPVA